MLPRTIDWDGEAVVIIDQTRLPAEMVKLRLVTVDQVIDAIRRLAVRGAPALGAAGALGLSMAMRNGDDPAEAAARLRGARPTAVNLAWGIDRVLAQAPHGPAAALAEACQILEEDEGINRRIGERGADLMASLIPLPARLITHCNAGGLACVGYGTALGVVRALHARGDIVEVFVDETRPLLQGARLTTFELRDIGVAHRLVVDAAGPSVIARGLVDAVIVGADRVAANGDVVNKVGTYPLALAAARAGIPFVVAAPESTIDPATATGAAVVIEERPAEEVIGAVAPPGTSAFNPAFDVTPADLVTAVVTEGRVLG